MISRRERLGVVAVLWAVAFVYVPGLFGDALDWDDGVWLGDPIHGLSPEQALSAAFTTGRDHVYAPLLRLSFWVLGNAFAVHLATLGLFLASIVGIHTVLRRLGVPPIPAGVAITIWALHPTKVECVAWVTGLKDVQSLALLVGMARALIPSPGDRPSILLGTVAGIAALLTKAAVFPVPFVVAGIVASQVDGREVVRRFGPVCVAALVLAAVGGAAWAPHGWPAFGRGWVPLWVHGAFWVRLVPSMPAAIVAVPADPRPWALLGVVLTGAWAAAAARWPRVGVPTLLVWLVPQLPFLGLVPMEFWASDRHLLIPSLGVAVGLALVAHGWFRSPWVVAAPLVVALGSAPISARRVHEWHDSLGLWEADVTRSGDHWARWHKLGVARGKAGQFAASEAAFDRALALNPTDRETLAHRLIASLAADGWTRTDAGLVRFLEPPPATDAAWAVAIGALRDAGEEELATYAASHVGAVR